MGISEEKGNSISKLQVKEKAGAGRQSLLAHPSCSLCPACCFPPVDLGVAFTGLDSISVRQRKTRCAKPTCWSTETEER